MNRPRIARWLRIAWSVAWGIVAVLLCVLWVRSYTWWDAAWRSTSTRELRIDSQSGEIFLRCFLTSGIQADAAAGIGSRPSLDIDIMPPGSYAGFRFMRGTDFGLFIPYWFSALVVATLATLPWMPWSNHFSLRTLLIAITLIGVGLGTIIWLSH